MSECLRAKRIKKHVLIQNKTLISFSLSYKHVYMFDTNLIQEDENGPTIQIYN